MKILLVKNDGAGFADYKDFEKGTTVNKLFALEMGDQSISNFMVRVNREEVAGTYVLEEGDRITITPTNIEGA